MADTTRIQAGGFHPVEESFPAERSLENRALSRGTERTEGSRSFGELLRARQGIAPGAPATPSTAPDVRFSAHAQARLQSRRIALNDTHIDRLQGAVQRAASKGSRDALVLMDDLALVVSVTNRTVVTVVDKDNLKQNVFTNIDSAVIA